MELVAKTPSKRPEPGTKVSSLRGSGQYLKNDLIDTMIFLEEFQVWYYKWLFIIVLFSRLPM